MKYTFMHNWRNFKPGDDVPDTLGEGMIQTMLTHGKIEPKQIDLAPQNKAILSSRKTRKKAHA